MKSKILTVLMTLVMILGVMPFFGVQKARAASTNPHPFATALQDFFSDATGEKGAYLINIPGAGEVVYAWKDPSLYQSPYSVAKNTAFFWLDNGTLESKIGHVPNMDNYSDFEIGYRITESGHLVETSFAYTGYYVFENGRFELIIEYGGEGPFTMLSYRGNVLYDIDRQDYTNADLARVMGDYDASLERLMRQYGIIDDDHYNLFDNRSDDTDRILAMTAGTPATNATHATATPTAPAQNNAINVTINNTSVNFTDQAPTIVDGRTLVPVRGVFETLGFDVSWNEQTRQVTLSKEKDTILITLDSASFTTNGKRHTLDVPAQIIGGRTMLPIRAVLESVGYSLGWDEATRTVIITVN